MAIFKVWDIRGRYDSPINYVMNDEKTNKVHFTQEELDSLQDIIRYTADSDKTTADDLQVYITGVGCNPLDARNQMATVRKQHGDKSEIISYHAIQSFKHGEVTPDIAHEIGIRFAEKMWGDNFQVLVTTHLNTNCLHNHFVINGTGLNGRRFYDNKEHLKKARAVSDDFCRQYKLYVIEEPKKSNISTYQKKATNAGEATKQNIAKDIIDEAIAHSFTKDDFFKQMKSMGYTCDFSEKRKYSRIYGGENIRSVRLHQLGKGYLPDEIFARIKENSVSVKYIPIQSATKTTGYRSVGKQSIFFAQKRGGFRGLYLHYCYRLGILPKGTQRNNARIHYLFRDDLMKIDRISAQTKLLFKYHIDTDEQLFSFKESCLVKSSELVAERNKLRSKLRSAKDPETVCEIKQQIAECSTKLKDLRWEVKHCDEIAQRSGVIAENLKQATEQEQLKQNGKEHNKDESFRRRR